MDLASWIMLALIVIVMAATYLSCIGEIWFLGFRKNIHEQNEINIEKVLEALRENEIQRRKRTIPRPPTKGRRRRSIYEQRYEQKRQVLMSMYMLLLKRQTLNSIMY